MNAREGATFDRILAKRRYQIHVGAFVLLGGLYTGIWAIGERGFYWPAVLVAGWGLHLVVCGVELYARPIPRTRILDVGVRR